MNTEKNYFSDLRLEISEDKFNYVCFGMFCHLEAENRKFRIIEVSFFLLLHARIHEQKALPLISNKFRNDNSLECILSHKIEKNNTKFLVGNETTLAFLVPLSSTNYIHLISG